MSSSPFAVAETSNTFRKTTYMPASGDFLSDAVLLCILKCFLLLTRSGFSRCRWSVDHVLRRVPHRLGSELLNVRRFVLICSQSLSESVVIGRNSEIQSGVQPLDPGKVTVAVALI